MKTKIYFTKVVRVCSGFLYFIKIHDPQIRWKTLQVHRHFDKKKKNVNILVFFCFYIQVTEDTAKILTAAGYECECRGPTYVKGKGTLTTYFVKTQYDMKLKQSIDCFQLDVFFFFIFTYLYVKYKLFKLVAFSSTAAKQGSELIIDNMIPDTISQFYDVLPNNTYEII